MWIRRPLSNLLFYLFIEAVSAPSTAQGHLRAFLLAKHCKRLVCSIEEGGGEEEEEVKEELEKKNDDDDVDDDDDDDDGDGDDGNNDDDDNGDMDNDNHMT